MGCPPPPTTRAIFVASLSSHQPAKFATFTHEDPSKEQGLKQHQFPAKWESSPSRSGRAAIPVVEGICRRGLRPQDYVAVGASSRQAIESKPPPPRRRLSAFVLQVPRLLMDLKNVVGFRVFGDDAKARSLPGAGSLRCVNACGRAIANQYAQSYERPHFCVPH